MAARTTEQVPRSGRRRPGFHMRPKHVGLVACVLLAGCMVAFGVGFIIGMGYKASEQISPYVVKKPLAAVSTAQQNVSGTGWEEGTMTFYRTLIKNEAAAMTPATETAQAPQPTPAAPRLARQTTPSVVAPPPSDQPPATTETAQAPVPVPDPASTPAPRAQTAVAAGADLADAAVSSGFDASVVGSYSVQVASVRTSERAERLIRELARKGHHAYVHPFEVPGQPLWYRVKVGNFTNRATAELILQELRSRETPDAFITRN